MLYITSFKNTNVNFDIIYKVHKMVKRYLARRLKNTLASI